MNLLFSLNILVNMAPFLNAFTHMETEKKTHNGAVTMPDVCDAMTKIQWSSTKCISLPIRFSSALPHSTPVSFVFPLLAPTPFRPGLWNILWGTTVVLAPFGAWCAEVCSSRWLTSGATWTTLDDIIYEHQSQLTTTEFKEIFQMMEERCEKLKKKLLNRILEQWRTSPISSNQWEWSWFGWIEVTYSHCARSC